MSSSSLERSSRKAAHLVADSKIACAAGGHYHKTTFSGERGRGAPIIFALNRENDENKGKGWHTWLMRLISKRERSSGSAMSSSARSACTQQHT